MQNLYKIIFLFIIGFSAQAQELLSLEEAVKIALENNYDIKIAENNSKIDATNNNLANAGILPSLNANLTNNNTQINIKQTQVDGTRRELDGAVNFNLNYGVSLDWTIFDGMSMFARKEQLKVLEEQGKLELQSAILTTVSDVYITYFDLVQQQKIIASIDTAIVISNQRLTTAQNRFSIGKAAKLEVLNAQVDQNTDLSLLLRQKEIYNNTKVRLNQILARNLQTEFNVNTAISFQDNIILNEILETAKKQNPQLQSQILSKRVADLNLKQIKGNRYPNIRLTSGYNIIRSETPLGFIVQSSAQGFVYGITATVPIFNGFLQSKNERVAKYQVDNSNLQIEQQKIALETQIISFYNSYQTNLDLVRVEEKNLEIAKQNLDITLAKFKIGTINTVEFRTAQQNFVEASVRYSNAQYLTKLSEINLKELAGTLNLN
jgi:outer membrane protein TolC